MFNPRVLINISLYNVRAKFKNQKSINKIYTQKIDFLKRNEPKIETNSMFIRRKSVSSLLIGLLCKQSRSSIVKLYI